MLKIDVVIPHINKQELLDQCIGYYRECCNPLITKLIIIDNGSTVPLVIPEPKNELEAILTIDLVRFETNQGMILSLIAAKDRSTADILMYTHSDHFIYEKDWDKMVSLLFASQETLGLAGTVGACIASDNGGRGDVFCSFRNGAQHGVKTPEDTLQYVAVLDGCCMIFRRKALDSFLIDTEFLPHHFYDKDWSLEVLTRGWNVAVLDLDCDHIGGQVTIGDEKGTYQNWATNYLKEKKIESAHHGDLHFYYANEARYLKKWNLLLPIKVNPANGDWTGKPEKPVMPEEEKTERINSVWQGKEATPKGGQPIPAEQEPFLSLDVTGDNVEAINDVLAVLRETGKFVGCTITILEKKLPFFGVNYKERQNVFVQFDSSTGKFVIKFNPHGVVRDDENELAQYAVQSGFSLVLMAGLNACVSIITTGKADAQAHLTTVDDAIKKLFSTVITQTMNRAVGDNEPLMPEAELKPISENMLSYRLTKAIARLKDIQHIVSAWKGHDEFAVRLVQYKKPQTTVDLGVDYGFSLFALALSDIGIVYGVDGFEGDPMTGFRNTEESVKAEIEKLKLTNVELIRGYFDDVVKTWDKPIDILHIDGTHNYKSVKNDFKKWAKHVKDDGVILIHDTESFPDDVGRFYNEIKLPKTKFTHSAGLAIVCKSREVLENILIHCKLSQDIEANTTVSLQNHH